MISRTCFLALLALTVSAFHWGCPKKPLDGTATAEKGDKKLRKGEPPPQPPVLPGGVLFRPSFDVDGEEARDGYAFSAEVGKDRARLIVTAMEVFGKLVESVKPPPWKLLPEKVKGCTLYDHAGIDAIGSAGPPLLLTKTWPASAPGPLFVDAGNDTVAFLPPEGFEGGALSLSDPTPAKGKSVWLVLAGEAGKLRLLHGKVVDSSEKALIFALDEKTGLAGTAGAPVVDASGSVAGIHIGIGFDHKGRFLAAACPSMRVRIHLLKGLDDLRKEKEGDK